MAANTLVTVAGRIAVQADISGILVQVQANGAVYSTANGGLPIDLTQVLTQGSPSPTSESYINPGDVYGALPVGLSANGFLPGALSATENALAALATYTTLPGASVRPILQLATCPVSIRLHGIGASNANHAGFGEVADGANTDTFFIILLTARGGQNA